MVGTGAFEPPFSMKTPFGAGAVGPLAWTAATARVLSWNRIVSDRQRLRDVQLAILKRNCETARDTEFGQGHRLGEVTSYEDFQERVPLRTYAAFEPYLERMRQ